MATVLAFAASPAAAQPVPADRAYRLAGTWTCQSNAGSTALLTFSTASDGSISMRRLFNASDRSSELDEVYRFVSPAQYWSWIATQVGRTDFKEAATAGMWTAQKWFFDGTVTQRPHRHDTETHRIRMIYTWISNASLEREFEIYEDDVWKTTSSYVCRRSNATR